MFTRVRRMLVRTAALAALCSTCAIATTSADSWSTQFALPTFNGEILSATTWNDRLVMGGRFTRAGQFAAARVVAWNGVTHETLGDGLPTAVTVLGTNAGVLYAFSQASGPNPGTLWSWNGANWTSVVTFPSGSAISAMTSHLGELHVGGSFTSIGGVPASRIARFDGSNWFAVGSGTTGTVSTLASFGGALYAGGSAILGPGSGAIYKWDGSTWSPPGLGVGWSPSGVPIVRTLFADPSGLIVAGSYNRAGSLVCSSPARWNGTTWECLSTPFATSSRAFVNRLGDLVGLVNPMGTGASRWTGSAWEGLADGLTSGVETLGMQGTDVYILGGFLHEESVFWKRWDGTAWSAPDPWKPEMHGLSHPVQDLIPYAGSLVALGSFSYVGDDGHLEQVGRIAAWDGSRWQPLGAGFDALAPATAATTFEGDLVVGGNISPLGSPTVLGVARWDGTAWSGFGAGLTYPDYPFVLDVEVHGTDLVACGYLMASGSPTVKGIARWDGSAWLPLGTGFAVPFEVPYTLLSDGADLLAGGEFVTAGGVSAARIARWDGMGWHAVGSGFANGAVSSLTRFGNELVAGGTFTVAGGSPANGVARFRDGAWVPMGTNAIDVRDFDVHGGALHAAGRFLREDLSTHTGLARWDGSTWVPLGGSATGEFASANAVASFGDEIFLGGSFDFVEGVPSVNIAAWQGSPLASAPPGHAPRATFAMPRPNPARSSVEFAFTLPQEGHVRLRIHDLQGREVARLEDGWRGAGPQSLTWDGRLAGGRRAIGVYQAVLDYAGGRLARRLVWLH